LHFSRKNFWHVLEWYNPNLSLNIFGLNPFLNNFQWFLSFLTTFIVPWVFFLQLHGKKFKVILHEKKRDYLKRGHFLHISFYMKEDIFSVLNYFFHFNVRKNFGLFHSLNSFFLRVINFLHYISFISRSKVRIGIEEEEEALFLRVKEANPFVMPHLPLFFPYKERLSPCLMVLMRFQLHIFPTNIKWNDCTEKTVSFFYIKPEVSFLVIKVWTSQRFKNVFKLHKAQGVRVAKW